MEEKKIFLLSWSPENEYYYSYDQQGVTVRLFKEKKGDSFKFGLIPVRNLGSCSWEYMDENGNLSRDSFDDAFEYSDDGIARVFDKGFYLFRDLKGNFSEQFYYASDYSCGFALVQIIERGSYYFRNTDGKVGQSFYWVDKPGYKDGFALVQKEKNGKKLYRDMLGNLSPEKTDLGKDIWLLSQHEISFDDLHDEIFLDTKAIDVVEEDGELTLTGFIGDIVESEYLRQVQAISGENRKEKANTLEEARIELIDYLINRIDCARTNAVTEHDDQTLIKDLSSRKDIKTIKVENLTKKR